MKKMIIFDFNGTIIDDLDLCIDILNKMLTDNGKSSITKERYKEIFTFPIVDYYKLAGFDFKEKSFEELSVDFINLYQKASLDMPLHEDVVLAFEEFKKLGIKLVCLSASEINNLTEQITHFGINKYFDAILGISDIYAKSKVLVGQNYLDNIDIDRKDVLMIGDTLHDKEVADKLGIDCVLYDKGHQSRNVLSKAKTKIVSSYKEFISYIKEE